MAEFIAIPLKEPCEVDVVEPLSNVVRSLYSGTDQKDYTETIKEFGKLRKNALWRAFEKFESSLEVIYNYYDQLCALEGKIPTHELQIPFKWKDAFDTNMFGKKLSLTCSTLAYEKLSVLFNIAALQSAVASIQSLESDEGLRVAAKLFQQSAGILSYLKDNGMPPVQAPDTLAALSSLMLAQAQEIFVHKAIHDSMKEEIIAKLAAQTDELYADALKFLQKQVFRSLWEKEWIPLVVGKQAGYRAMAEFYQALVCKNNKLFGEQIARLEHSVELFKAAQRPSIFQTYADRAQRSYNEVKKDNDFIYHARIPDIGSLKPIGKANVAKLLPVSHPMSANFKDIFEDLLPVIVHNALTSYEGRKNELVNSEISKLREMTQVLNNVLATLNLPAAIEDTSGTELPRSLLSKASSIRTAGGIKALETAINELPVLLERNKEILDESERLLGEESDCDSQLRDQFKERWNRISSSRLNEQFRVNARKYREIIDNAVAADKVVREKFETHREGMEILSMDENQLLSAIPTGSAVQESGAVSRLRNLMQSVESLKRERDAIESELKSATTDMKATFLSALVKDGAIDEPNLSVESIGKCYGPLGIQIRESLARQETLIKDIQTSHADFTSEQSGTGSSRETMLCKLAAAHDAFKELKNNLHEGAKFYNDLTQLLIVFQNKITDFCFARKTEKEELLKDLTTNLSHAGPAPTPNIPAHHGTGPPGIIQSNEGNPQPLPYPTSYQGMPIPYGATPAAPYPTYLPPPMPSGHNPYATMPYPSQGQQHNSQFQGQGHPQSPWGGFATLPRWTGDGPTGGQKPW